MKPIIVILATIFASNLAWAEEKPDSKTAVEPGLCEILLTGDNPPDLEIETHEIFQGLASAPIQYRVVKPLADGSPLNRIAFDLASTNSKSKMNNTKLGVATKSPYFKGAYYSADNLIILNREEGEILAHEARHRYFETQLRSGITGVFSGATNNVGSAISTLEELYTYPLTLRIMPTAARLATAKTFRDLYLNPKVLIRHQALFIFYVEPDENPATRGFPLYAEEILGKLKAGQMQVFDKMAVGGGDRIKLEQSKIPGLIDVTFSRQGLVPLTLTFALELNRNTLQTMIPLAEKRLVRLKALHAELTQLNDTLIAKLEAGESGDAEVRALINAARLANRVHDRD